MVACSLYSSSGAGELNHSSALKGPVCIFSHHLLSEIKHFRHEHDFIVFNNIYILMEVLNFASIEICVKKLMWVFLNTCSSKTKSICIEGIPFFIHREMEIFLELH